VSVGDFDQITKAISENRFFDLPDVIGPGVVDAEQVAVTVTTLKNQKRLRRMTYQQHQPHLPPS
jgi:hypothetical protein